MPSRQASVWIPYSFFSKGTYMIFSRAYASRLRSPLLLAATATYLLLASAPAAAQDKSGSKQGLVKLPSPGGTVSAEGSTFVVQTNTGAANYSIPLPTLPG